MVKTRVFQKFIVVIVCVISTRLVRLFLLFSMETYTFVKVSFGPFDYVTKRFSTAESAEMKIC